MGIEVEDSLGRIDCLIQSVSGNVYRASVSKFLMLTGEKVTHEAITNDALIRLKEEVDKDRALVTIPVHYR